MDPDEPAAGQPIPARPEDDKQGHRSEDRPAKCHLERRERFVSDFDEDKAHSPNGSQYQHADLPGNGAGWASRSPTAGVPTADFSSYLRHYISSLPVCFSSPLIVNAISYKTRVFRGDGEAGGVAERETSRHERPATGTRCRADFRVESVGHRNVMQPGSRRQAGWWKKRVECGHTDIVGEAHFGGHRSIHRVVSTMTPVDSDSSARQMASLAALLADCTRARMCLALLDGRSWTAGELARHAGVAASTATEHISLLVDGGLLTDERQGRHRYVRLAGWEAAQLIEVLGAHTATLPAGKQSLRSTGAAARMARARTCYDHLAGRLGVLVTDSLTRSGYLDQSAGFAVTTEGVKWLEQTLGHELDPPRTTHRPLARGCLDFTERKPHLAGLAGALLCRHFLTQRWVIRLNGQRAVRVTQSGREALHSIIGIDEDRIKQADFDVLYE